MGQNRIHATSSSPKYILKRSCFALTSIDLFDAAVIARRQSLIRQVSLLRDFCTVGRTNPITKLVFETTVLRVIAPTYRAVSVSVAKSEFGFDRINRCPLRCAVVKQSVICQTIDVGFTKLEGLICDADFASV